MLTISTNGSIEEVICISILVEVGGRVLHRSQMLIYNRSNGADGYEYVVPLLAREDKDRSNQQGLILSKGFLPFACRDIGVRYRI